MTPANLKVNANFCDQNLLKSWAAHDVRVAAGVENLPFEEKFVEGIVDGVDAQIEKMIFQGETGQTNQFEGLISIMETAGTTANTATMASGTSAYAAIKKAYALLPEEAIKDDAVIFVSNGVYRQFIQELVAANLYHHEASEGNGEYMLPGTNTRVIATPGLNGTSTYNYILAGRLSNIYYGIFLRFSLFPIDIRLSV